MMDLTRCYKTEVFFTFIFAVFLQHFMLFLLVTAVKEPEIYLQPNFDEIS